MGRPCNPTHASLAQSKTYLIDAIDFLRQIQANHGNIVYQKMEISYNQKDTMLFKRYAGKFLRLISLDDSLLNLNKNFRLDTWLDAAIGLGKTPYEKKLMEKNARTQITYWGSDNASTDLHDYANKDWSGMLSTFYLPRWEMFMKQSLQQLEGKPVLQINYFKFEQAWAKRQRLTPIIYLSPDQEDSLIKQVLQEAWNL